MQQRRKKDAYIDQQETGGVDLPQAFPDESPSKVKAEKRLRKRKAKESPEGNGWIISFVLLMTIVLVASYFLVSHHEKVQLEHLRQDIIHDQVEPLSREWEEKYTQLEEENVRLKKAAQAFSLLGNENVKLLEEKGHANKLRENQDVQIERLTKYKKQMQESIQLMSKTASLEK
jgi:cytochrome c-type biogenesis protein CcmH/NrfG